MKDWHEIMRGINRNFPGPTPHERVKIFLISLLGPLAVLLGAWLAHSN